MRFCVSLAAVLVLCVFSLMACNRKNGSNVQTSVRAQSSPPADGVRRVTIAELRDALEKGEAVVVDVRGTVEYNLGHIKGARSLPLGLIAEQARDLPQGKLIITYCA